MKRLSMKAKVWLATAAIALVPMGLVVGTSVATATPGGAPSGDYGTCSRNISTGYGFCGWDGDPGPGNDLCSEASADGNYWIEYAYQDSNGDWVKLAGPWERDGTSYICTDANAGSGTFDYQVGVLISNQSTTQPVTYTWYQG